VIMGRPDRPEFAQELEDSFCRTNPAIARQFAHVTFLSDNRADLSLVQTPTLVLQCTDDVIAPVAVGEFVRDQMPNATMVLLNATGHCPHLSAPDETADAIEQFLDSAALVER
jgi:sigma-B regulation protein RsbQ